MTDKQRKQILKGIPRTVRDDLRHVMATKQGRRFVRHIIYDVCGLEGISYASHANDTAFREGQRKVGSMLQSLVQLVTPQEFTAMMAEKLQEDLERLGDAPQEENLDE